MNTILTACEHRDHDSNLVLAEMTHIRCRSTFWCFEPLEEYRRVCPQFLIVCRGEHTHPIPLPTKTPPTIRVEIFDLLKSLDQDLANLTPRRFLWHSVTAAHLQQWFPTIEKLNLADLHVSLANHEHVRTYILQVQKQCFPFGTGWKGDYHNILHFSCWFNCYRTLLSERVPRPRSTSWITLHPIHQRSPC